ncbi:MAG: cytochrome-c peroxidase, partial [Cytophagaceae bacterium]
MRLEQPSTVVTPNATRFSLWWLIVLIAGLLFLCAVYGFVIGPNPMPAQAVKQAFMEDVNELDSAVSQLQQVIRFRRSDQTIQTAFRQARLAYKRTEFLTAYYNPETSRSLNGPNIPDVDDDLRINAPEGFQVLEELLFPALDTENLAEAVQQAAVIRSNVNRLRKISENNELTDSHIFDAMRLEVFRIISLSITGFDSPIAFYSLPEAASALERMQQQVAYYKLVSKDADLSERLDQAFASAIKTLQSAHTFDTFDRLGFISQQANVLSSLLLDAQQALAIPVFTENRLLSTTARTLTDTGVFNPTYFIN